MFWFVLAGHHSSHVSGPMQRIGLLVGAPNLCSGNQNQIITATVWPCHLAVALIPNSFWLLNLALGVHKVHNNKLFTIPRL